ncbi:hypothetical protein ABT150_52780 [Streptomyces mirabilis]|uniref:hypothetical protein n=1 Tax=Streptomyces mirabilis TaxID=68239 RepID=UPI003319EF77
MPTTTQTEGRSEPQQAGLLAGQVSVRGLKKVRTGLWHRDNDEIEQKSTLHFLPRREARGAVRPELRAALKTCTRMPLTDRAGADSPFTAAAEAAIQAP